MWVRFVMDQAELKFTFEHIGFLFPVSFHQRSELTGILIVLLKGKGKVIPLQARCGPEGG